MVNISEPLFENSIKPLISPETKVFRSELVDKLPSEEWDYWKKADNPEPIHYPEDDCLIQNENIADLFLNTFKIADNRIDIICPWINQYVVNKKLIDLFKYALMNGVKIHIRYGIGTGEDKRKKTSNKVVQILKERFAEYGNQIVFEAGNTHVKVLICDTKFMLIGSYNFLSFAGNYSDNPNIWDEAVECITSVRKITQRREQLFH